jgi:hypothetical protein
VFDEVSFYPLPMRKRFPSFKEVLLLQARCRIGGSRQYEAGCANGEFGRHPL